MTLWSFFRGSGGGFLISQHYRATPWSFFRGGLCNGFAPSDVSLVGTSGGAIPLQKKVGYLPFLSSTSLAHFLAAVTSKGCSAKSLIHGSMYASYAPRLTT